VKLPKKYKDAKTYNIECIKQDLESIFICKLIVDDLNERLISSIDSRNLENSFRPSFMRFKNKKGTIQVLLWRNFYSW
jgi:hypothetical protein